MPRLVLGLQLEADRSVRVKGCDFSGGFRHFEAPHAVHVAVIKDIGVLYVVWPDDEEVSSLVDDRRLVLGAVLLHVLDSLAYLCAQVFTDVADGHVVICTEVLIEFKLESALTVVYQRHSLNYSDEPSLLAELLRLGIAFHNGASAEGLRVELKLVYFVVELEISL